MLYLLCFLNFEEVHRIREIFHFFILVFYNIWQVPVLPLLHLLVEFLTGQFFGLELSMDDFVCVAHCVILSFQSAITR